MSVSGHLWTIGSLAARTVFTTEAPPSESWATSVEDRQTGTVRLSGRLSRPAGARDLVVLVHGLGGSSESTYMKSAARTAAAHGLASLRLNLRGADGEMGDFYHGGLTDDLAAATLSLAPSFERISVLGFSLGGHVALRFATEVSQRAVRAFAAVCAPLDLGAGVDAIDRPLMAPYRAYVLRRLKANYVKTARLGSLPTPPEALKTVSKLRDWDSLTVVPRFGFEDTDDYYAKVSVGSRIRGLKRPALLVAAEHDPMIPPSAIRPHLGESLSRDTSHPNLTVRWLDRGGHVALPRSVDLELDGSSDPRDRADYVSQILHWFQRA